MTTRFKLILCFLLAFVLTACAKTPKWQEQYNLGARYLSEGNYKEAVIAFTAAIEIDPLNASAYIGRADAYQLSEENDDNLNAALEDYLKAIELTPQDADIYKKAAKVYILLEKPDEAKELIEQGYAVTNNADLKMILDDWSVIDYGGTPFMLAGGYQDFEKLTEEEQELVVSVLNALKAKDKNALAQCVMPSEDFFLTIYEGYKIYLWTGGSYALQVQVRPENGVGYHCEMGNNYWLYTTCSCENWQWNGTLHETAQRLYPDLGQSRENVMTCEIRNNLRVGEGVEIETSYYSDGTVVPGCDTTRVTYENGQEIVRKKTCSLDGYTTELSPYTLEPGCIWSACAWVYDDVWW